MSAKLIVDEPDIEALARRVDVHTVVLTIADTMFKNGRGRESRFTKGGLWLSLSDLSAEVIAKHPDWQLRGKPVQIGSMANAIQLGRKETGYLELQAGMVRISEGGEAELSKFILPTPDEEAPAVATAPEGKRRGRPRKRVEDMLGAAPIAPTSIEEAAVVANSADKGNLWNKLLERALSVVGEQQPEKTKSQPAVVATPLPRITGNLHPQWRNAPPPERVWSPTRETARREGRKMRPSRTADKRIIYSMPGKVDKIPITALGFIAEQATELHTQGIQHIGELRALSATKLEKLGIKGRSLELIRKLLEAHGLYLLGEDKLETERPIHPVEDELLRRAGQDSFLFIRVEQVDDWPERLKKQLETWEIYLLRDLVQQSEDQLHRKGIFGKDLDQIRTTLAGYELHLEGESLLEKKLKPRIQRMRENGFYLTDMLLDLPEPKFADLEYARLLLGRDFPLFDAIRRSSPPERVNARNKLTVKNHRLALKASTKNPWYAKLVENREDPAIDIEDIQQELSIALMYAFEGYDYGSGNKPSTYAFVWFRQAATRMLHNSGRVRVPVHQHEALVKYLKAQARLYEDLGRRPSPEELQKELGLADKSFQNMQAAVFWMTGEAISMDAPSPNGHAYKASQEGDEGDAFGDTFSLLLEAMEFDGPISDASRTGSVTEDLRQERVATAIYNVVNADVLMDVERHVIIRRYGLDGDEPETFQEIGERLGVSHQRVRQRQEDALKKLRESDLWDDEVLEGYHPNGLDGNGKELTVITTTTPEDGGKATAPKTADHELLDVIEKYYDYVTGDAPNKHDPLHEVERLVIIRRFGLDGKAQQTLAEIGETLGVTRERIRQREKAALQKLRDWGGITPTVTKAQEIATPTEPVAVPTQKDKGKHKPEHVIKTACEYFYITQEEVKGSSRTQPLARRRQVIMYLLREVCGCSYPETGRLLDRDHTSAIHGYEKIRELVQAKAQPVIHEVNHLLRELNQSAE